MSSKKNKIIDNLLNLLDDGLEKCASFKDATLNSTKEKLKQKFAHSQDISREEFETLRSSLLDLHQEIKNIKEQLAKMQSDKKI